MEMHQRTVALAIGLVFGLSWAVSAAPVDFAPSNDPSGWPGQQSKIFPPLAAPADAPAIAGGSAPVAGHFVPPPRDLIDSPIIPLPRGVYAGSAGLLLVGWMAMRVKRRGGRV